MPQFLRCCGRSAFGPFSQPHFIHLNSRFSRSYGDGKDHMGNVGCLGKIDEALVIKGISRRAVWTLLPHLCTACATEMARHD